MRLNKFFLISILVALVFLIQPLNSAASQDLSSPSVSFKARVTKIIEEKIDQATNSTPIIKQKLELVALSGPLENQVFIFDGTQFEVISAARYQLGDRVIVSQNINNDGEIVYYVIDYDRSRIIWFLSLLFALAVIIVGRLKGIRALVVLVLTFLIILKLIIPLILAGFNPLLISILGSLLILIIAIYLTEGFGRSSHVAVLSILLSLVITGVISMLFASWTKLSGFSSEEVSFLLSAGIGVINVQGLLLAGIIIGSLGVLDDVVISQTITVQQLRQANPQLGKGSIYSQAMKVGVSHMSSMVNTLFLAYAGASLPLLLLFTVNAPQIGSWSELISNELLATEIVRTLAGSIGLVLSVPITTFLAVWFLTGTEKTKASSRHFH